MATPFRDFAGSTMVHSIGGAISLIGSDQRSGRAGSRVPARRRGPPLPHIIIPRCGRRPDPLVRLYGFNPGSTLCHGRPGSRVSFNTTMAAARAASPHSSSRMRAWRSGLGLTTNGFPGWPGRDHSPCYWVSPTGAFFIGIVASGVVIMAMDALATLRIDDPIGAVPVHLCAVSGARSARSLFCHRAVRVPTATGVDTSTLVKGLIYGGGMAQLTAQAITAARRSSWRLSRRRSCDV